MGTEEILRPELAGLGVIGLGCYLLLRRKSPLRWLSVVFLGLTVALPLYLLSRFHQAGQKKHKEKL